MLFFFLQYRCDFDSLFNITNYKPHPDNNRMILSSDDQEKHPIRIHFNFNPITSNNFGNVCRDIDQEIYRVKCEEGDIVTTERFEILNGTLTNIASYLETFMSVKSLESLRITSADDESNGRVVNNADLIVNVFVRPYGDKDILAQAMPTRYGSDGRPVEGSIYINLKELPSNITDINSPNRFFFDVALHELFHVLGFVSQLFYTYINPSTGKKYGNSLPLKTIELPAYPGKKFRMLQTPYALKVSQKRFNTTGSGKNELLGIEIEDGGGPGTEGSHVKGRLYYNDIMCGFCMSPSRISEVTAAVLLDSGWYDINWSMVEPLAWGIGESMGTKQDSEFSTKPPQLYPEHYTCKPEENETRVCNYDFSGVSDCGVLTYNSCSVNKKDQCSTRYYDWNNTHYFGPLDTHDWMPLLKSRDYLLCSTPWTTYKKYDNAHLAEAGDMVFGSNSNCAKVKIFVNQTLLDSSGCYDMTCQENNSIKIITAKESFVCNKKDERITMGRSIFICPDPTLLCSIKKFYSKDGFSLNESLYLYTENKLYSSAAKVSIIATSVVGVIVVFIVAVLWIKKGFSGAEVRHPDISDIDLPEDEKLQVSLD